MKSLFKELARRSIKLLILFSFLYSFCLQADLVTESVKFTVANIDGVQETPPQGCHVGEQAVSSICAEGNTKGDAIKRRVKKFNDEFDQEKDPVNKKMLAKIIIQNYDRYPADCFKGDNKLAELCSMLHHNSLNKEGPISAKVAGDKVQLTHGARKSGKSHWKVLYKKRATAGFSDTDGDGFPDKIYLTGLAQGLEGSGEVIKLDLNDPVIQQTLGIKPSKKASEKCKGPLGDPLKILELLAAKLNWKPSDTASSFFSRAGAISFAGFRGALDGLQGVSRGFTKMPKEMVSMLWMLMSDEKARAAISKSFKEYFKAKGGDYNAIMANLIESGQCKSKVSPTCEAKALLVVMNSLGEDAGSGLKKMLIGVKDHVVKCGSNAKKGLNDAKASIEFSECMGEVALIALTTAAGGGLAKAAIEPSSKLTGVALRSAQVLVESFNPIGMSPSAAKNYAAKMATELLEQGYKLPAKSSDDILMTIVKAEKSLGRSLTGPEKKALLKAHYTAMGEAGLDGATAQVNNYTRAQNMKKAKLLREVFGNADSRKLLDEGVAGYKLRGSRIREVDESMEDYVERWTNNFKRRDKEIPENFGKKLIDYDTHGDILMGEGLYAVRNKANMMNERITELAKEYSAGRHSDGILKKKAYRANEELVDSVSKGVEHYRDIPGTGLREVKVRKDADGFSEIVFPDEFANDFDDITIVYSPKATALGKRFDDKTKTLYLNLEEVRRMEVGEAIFTDGPLKGTVMSSAAGP